MVFYTLPNFILKQWRGQAVSTPPPPPTSKLLPDLLERRLLLEEWNSCRNNSYQNLGSLSDPADIRRALSMPLS